MIRAAVNARLAIMERTVQLAARSSIVLETSPATRMEARFAMPANQVSTEINARHVDRFQIVSEA